MSEHRSAEETNEPREVIELARAGENLRYLDWFLTSGGRLEGFALREIERLIALLRRSLASPAR